MRRFGLILSLVTLVLLAPVALHGPSRAQAQDATPASGPPAGTPEAVVSTTLASGTIEITAPGTAGLALGRIKLAPGATVPFDPADPSVSLVYMTAGTLTFRVDAPMSVSRKAGPGTPVPAQSEAIAANTEFILRDGDSAIFPPATAGEVRNDGAEEATAWVVNVALRSEAAGTPTP